jgi:CheY-like chemotaxis protein
LLNKDPAHLADAVRVISRSATHLTGLIDGLIDVSRIENGSVRIQRAPVNLHDLLEQLGDMFRLQAATRGIQFSHNRAPHLPQWVYSDEKRLRQILINLISNAIKYTPQGSASLAVHWRNPVAEFEIKDTGVGIAADDMKRIFEPFERINTVRGQPGVGLGLTITRLLADIMGGQVTVESQPGAGSVFRVKMFFSEAPGTGRKAESAAVAQGNAGITRTILVADDDPGHLDLVRGILSPLGCRLLFAQDGAECLRLYREHRPNLILLDIAMPQMNGWEVARTIRGQEQDEEVSILMVSANVHDFQRPRHVDDPHDDYLFKPYDVEEMRERVLTLIGPVATTDGMQPS